MCICSTVGKHTLACNRHEIKCFLLQESTDRMCFGACLVYNILISFVSGYHNHPSVRHVSTYQGISHGHKIVHVGYTVQKNIWWSSLFIIFGAKTNTNCFVTIKRNFVFGSTVTTNIQKDVGVHWYCGWTRIYHQRTLDDSQPYFPQCIPPCWTQLFWKFIKVNSK